MLSIYWLYEYCPKLVTKNWGSNIFHLPYRPMDWCAFGNVWKFRPITGALTLHCFPPPRLILLDTPWYFYGHGISGIVNNSCTFTSQRYQHWTTYSYTGRTALLTVFRNWFGFLPQSVAAASVLAVSIFWRVLASPLTTIISILSCPLFPFLVSIFLSCPFSEGFWRRQP